METAPRMDRRLRTIAEKQGMTNLNSPSPSRLNRAAPKVNAPPINPELGVKHWGMGITSQFSAHGPVCVEAAGNISLKGTLAVGSSAVPRGPNNAFPSPMANAIVEGRTSRRTVT